MAEKSSEMVEIPLNDETGGVTAASRGPGAVLADTPTPAAAGANKDHAAPHVYPKFSPIREGILVFTLMFAQIITQAAVAQGLMPLNNIGETFGVSEITTLSWSIAAYSLTVGTFILCAGRLGDLYGHKKMYIFGFAWLVLWSLLSGFSHYTDFIFFAICRGFQGIGPAFLLPNALAIIGRSYPPGVKQTMLFSLFGACAPSGFVFGAVFTSIMSQYVSWEWTYYLGAIVCALVGVICIFVIPSDEGPELRTGSFDGWGAVLGVSGLILVNVAWNQGPNVGWTTPYTYILLIIGALLLGGFFFAETKASHPLIPASVFNVKTSLALACIACGWGAFGIWIFFLLQMQLTLRELSPLLVTAQASPVVISGLVASGVTGFLLTKRVPVAIVMLFAMSAFLAAGLLLATMPVDQIYWAQTFVSFVVAPFGMDMSFPAATIMFSASVPREHQGMVASLVTTVVNYSISLALGFAGTVVLYTSPGQSEADLTAAIHNAAFMGVGLSGLGVILASIACSIELVEYLRKKTKGSSPEP